jgi:hypothetical protein
VTARRNQTMRGGKVKVRPEEEESKKFKQFTGSGVEEEGDEKREY